MLYALDKETDIDEFFDQLKKSEERAKERLTRGQRELDVGDWFITIEQSLGVMILNHAISLTDSEDISLDEENKKRGYIFVEAMSRMCKEGEMGSVHRSKAVAKVKDIAHLDHIRTLINLEGDDDRLQLLWMVQKGIIEELT